MLFLGPYHARKAYAGFIDFDVTADGGRFLFVKPIAQAEAQAILVTLN